MTKVLALETSCDETAAAVLEHTSDGLRALASVVSSQIALHKEWGGVVPQLASHEHIKNLPHVLRKALARAEVTPEELDFLAVTQGPGLMPALLVGVNAAKTLSLLWQKPLMGVQHLEGHIYANLLPKNQESRIRNQGEIQKPELSFPLLALVVSGGHTQLMLMRDHFQYELLGETQDDAAGEAFDKVARMLGLPYPGGPEVAKRADDFRMKNLKLNIKNLADQFPRPMLAAANYDFSFSGLKTAVLYYVRDHADQAQDERFVAETCHEFQEAVVDVLVGKTERALDEFAPQTFVIAGGVAANARLRSRLAERIAERFPTTRFLTPDFQYSLDNAAMIGAAALMRYAHLDDSGKAALTTEALALEPDANLPFSVST